MKKRNREFNYTEIQLIPKEWSWTFIDLPRSRWSLECWYISSPAPLPLSDKHKKSNILSRHMWLCSNELISLQLHYAYIQTREPNTEVNELSLHTASQQTDHGDLWLMPTETSLSLCSSTWLDCKFTTHLDAEILARPQVLCLICFISKSQ